MMKRGKAGELWARGVFTVGLWFAACSICLDAAEPEKKYHPGHYVAINEAEQVSSIKHLDEPALRGVNRRYYWADLEPRQDGYDFSAIRKDLEKVKALKKQLIVFITDKTFGAGRNPLPEYLASYALPNFRGVTAKRWDPVVVERLVALSRALAKDFDNDPNFEGIAFQESALMINPATQRQQGYTPEKYRDALIQILTQSSQALPHSQVFWYMNHLEGNEEYLGDVAQAIVPAHVVMGGPDILPYRKRLQQTYRLYEKFHGQMKLFCSAQDDSYRHDKNDSRNMGTAGALRNQPAPAGGYVPMDEIFLFARDQLHVSYVFWSYKAYPGATGAWTFEDAVGVMRKYPEF